MIGPLKSKELHLRSLKNSAGDLVPPLEVKMQEAFQCKMPVESRQRQTGNDSKAFGVSF
jgi:hypothetical protein